MTDAQEIARTCARVREAGDALRALGLSRRAEGIAAAAALLCDPDSETGRAVRRALARTSGLTPPLIEWGLTTTLRRFEPDALCALAGDRALPGRGLAATVLAGNVFSAAARPLLLPLLSGLPCVAKGSSRDAALAQHLVAALATVCPPLGAAAAVLAYRGGDAACDAALLSQASVVSLYGGDAAIAALRRHVAPRARLLAHGHGLGLALVERGDDVAVARALARDICAYDQRGCLSPHAVYVLDDAARFARVLAAALAERATHWPRGALPAVAAAEQLQWRGVAAARGELHTGEGFAVSFEGGEPLRASCGYRNVGVYSCESVPAFSARARALGAHLKALGTTWAGAAELAPYVCAPGEMQDPPLAAALDGLHPLAGFCD